MSRCNTFDAVDRLVVLANRFSEKPRQHDNAKQAITLGALDLFADLLDSYDQNQGADGAAFLDNATHLVCSLAKTRQFRPVAARMSAVLMFADTMKCNDATMNQSALTAMRLVSIGLTAKETKDILNQSLDSVHLWVKEALRDHPINKTPPSGNKTPPFGKKFMI